METHHSVEKSWIATKFLLDKCRVTFFCCAKKSNPTYLAWLTNQDNYQQAILEVLTDKVSNMLLYSARE